MKNTSKILALVLIVMTVLMSLTAITASAEAPEKLYLTPSANWKESNARFAAYFFGNGEKWVSMTDPDGDGVYEVDVPAGYPSVIFCRMNPSAAANNWTNKWNQTSDLTIPTGGANHYTVKEGTWDKGGGTWSTFGSTCTHANLGEAATCTTPQECLDCGDPVVSALGHTYNDAHLCTRCNEQATFTVAGTGAHLGTEWDTGNVANDMTYADGVYTKVYENVAAGTYKFKVARDHDWGTAYPSADKSFTVSTAGSTVIITLTGTTVDVVVEAPHEHNYVDGKCECGEEDPNYVPPHVHSHEAVVTAPTCTEAGYTTYTCSCGDTYTGDEVAALGHNIVADAAVDATCTATGLTAGEHCSRCDHKVAQEEVPALGHDYVDGVCSRCTAEDPNYVPPVVGPVDPIVNISDLVAGTTDGGELIPGTGISASAGLAIDSNKKSIDGFDFILRLKLGGKMEINEDGSIKAGVKIVTDGAAKIVVYAMSSSSSDSTRTLQIASLVDGALVKLGETAGVDGSAIAKYELTVDAAGTYYLGSTKSGINLYYIAVEAAEVEPPHEHSYEAVVTAPTCTAGGYTTYTCSCGDSYVADEVAATGHVCVLDICMVCYLPQPSLVLGENTVVVPESGSKFGMIYIAEAGTYKVTGAEDQIVCIFTDSIYATGSDFSIAADGTLGASWNNFSLVPVDLAPGYYYVGIYGLGEYTITIEEYEAPAECEHVYFYMNCTLCGAANPHFIPNLLVAGENKVVCNEYHLVDTTGHGFPYQFTLLTVEEDGLYIISCDEKILGVTIYTIEINSEGADFTAGTGTSWGQFVITGQAELKAGTYYIGFIYTEGEGEYLVDVTKHEHAHESVVTAPTCTEAGYTTYTCSCGDTYVADEVEALGHDYVDGVCSRCEAADPDYVAPQPPVDEDPKDEPTDEPTEEPKLGFFDKIMKAIKDFFAKIMAFFKGMFKF